ncbi:MAG: polyprenyl synthetase family protein [Cryobacterium sp.]|nr:polyprenyl synthetase family protein [Oligoflexia bacterium]
MDSRFETALAELSKNTLTNVPAHLRESILYSLLSGGKRIRPRIVRAVSEVLGLSESVAMKLATAVEMVHAYTLVHDDLPAMDDDDTRRGKPTNHRAFGEATAILAGDSLALLAFDVLESLRGELNDGAALDTMRLLLDAAGARGVVAGQSSELDLMEGRSPKNLETLFEIFRLKTGALFRASIALPFAAAGRTLPERFGLLGETVGIAFQIADDLEDDFGAMRGNPAHVAAYLIPGEARLKAEEMLVGAMAASSESEPEITKALSYFVDELLRKVSESSAL